VRTVQVGTQVSGQIAALYVDFNSHVKKGQLIARIDPILQEAAVQDAEAGLAKANAVATQTQLDYERSKKLHDQQIATDAEYNVAQSSYAQAKASLTSARINLQRAKQNLSYTNIYSPIDGVVVERTMDVGQTVAASFSAPQLFVIANDLSRMQILAAVDEADVGKVKAGMPARFTVDAFPGDVFQGRIREVRQAPTNVQNVITYAAVIEAPNGEGKLRQGMTASVNIVTNARESALRIPNLALRYRPAADRDGAEGSEGAKLATAALGRADAADGAADGAAPVKGVRKLDVYKLAGGKVVRAAIVVGISDGHKSEVVAGLAEGDEVVVGEAAQVAAAGGKRGPF
jgi:HlyD family secretion protein